MQAVELLRLYEAGRRNFRGENLRGQNFNEKDLSGADFSGADIRGANFSNANLRETNFKNITAGLQKRWFVPLVAMTLVLINISCAFSFFGCAFALLIFDYSRPENQIAGWTTLVGVLIPQHFAVRKGLGSLVSTLTLFLALIVVSAFASILVVYGFWNIASLIFGSEFLLQVEVLVKLVAKFAGSVAGVIFVSVVFLVLVSVLSLTGALTGALAGALAGALDDSEHEGLFIGSLFYLVVIGVVYALATKVAGPLILLGFGVGIIVLINTYIGWRALRGDERNAWVRSVAVAFAAMGGTSFRGADLTDANFTQAQLKGTDLRRAFLRRTRWHHAKKLGRTRPAETILLDPVVRDLLVTHRGQGKSYVGCKLQGANLMGVDLSDANLKEADISQATLEGAWLERSNLSKTQALGTNFHQANLTGACLESWNIDSTTQLEGAICEYVYLLNSQQERRPNSGTFAPGEFTKLFEEVLDTIDLIFRNGLDWKAFVAAFGKVRVENGDTELDIQSIENRGDGVMVVKLQASSNADKEQIHQAMMAEYDIARKAIEEKYRAQLQAKDDQITQYHQQNTNLWEMARLMANRPIDVSLKKEKSMPLTDEQINILSAIKDCHKSNEEVAKELEIQPDLVFHYMQEMEKTGYIKCVVATDKDGYLIAFIEPKGRLAMTAPEKILPSSDANVQVTNDFRHAQIGAFAKTVHGNQRSTINNYGTSLDDITRLLSALREQAQMFPVEKKDDAIDILDDIESDLNKPEPDHDRIGRRLKRLIAISAAVGTIAGSAATFSGSLNDFTSNIIELTETLGIPPAQVHPQPLPPVEKP
ncbi:MAG: pentapeptide repeat-containing protein [Cyanobacteria bacterium P01_F01_bin.150]